MKTNLLTLQSELVLRAGHRARNRVVVPPMASETADEAGLVTDRTLAHYARLARSGAGIVMVEYSFVARTGRSEPHQLGADSDDTIPGLARIARAIREASPSQALTFLQLTHAGGKSERALTGGVLEGPSDISVPVKDRELEAPVPVPLERVAALREAFVHAVRRAVEAGFDGIELHAAHGYGINQWLSPLTNRRADKYGGDGGPDGRARLLLEIVRAIRARYSRLLISIRFPGQDNLPGGLSAEDAQALARALEGAGVDLLNVSSGLGGWRRPGGRVGEGYLVDDAARIQTAVSIPVIGVGGIQTAAFIDRGLGEGRFGLAAVGRAILQDAEGWGRDNLNIS